MYHHVWRLMTPEEISSRSVAVINKDAGVRFLVPDQAEGTLCDRRLGPALLKESCKTCFEPYTSCPGHFGHIPLAISIIPDHLIDFVLTEFRKSYPLEKNAVSVTKEVGSLVITYKDQPNRIITAEDLIQLDKQKWNRYILKNMVVLPINVRPYTPYKKSEHPRADNLTQLYAKIIHCNVELEQNMDKPQMIIDVCLLKLKQAISTFYDSSKKTGGEQICKGMHQRIDGKFGRVKGNIMGTRVNYSARAVITADITLKVDQVGVSEHFCNSLTTPQLVTPQNIQQLQKDVYINKFKYKSYQTPDDDHFELKYVTGLELQPGGILHRVLQDDDVVIMNRQPSLHKASMMAFRIKKLPYGRTFRMPLSVCKAFNADFDGDEMNMHVPQTVDSIVDVTTLMNVKENILSPQSGNVLIGLIYDAVLGVSELFRHDVIIPERMVGDICCLLNIWPLKGTKTGIQMLELILPSFELLPNGTINYGTIKKIVKQLYMDYSVQHAYDFLNKIQFITNYWMDQQGFSTGMQDGGGIGAGIETISSSLSSSESEIMTQLNSYRDQFKIPSNQEENGLIRMIQAGSKGSAINYIQTAFVLGQQSMYGQRLIPFGHGEGKIKRLLPHFDFNKTIGIKEGGFISSNFYKGLNPIEMFQLAMCGRANIADTAVQTPESGYLAKQLCKCMENVRVHYDGTVRRNNIEIIQLQYGNDGLKAEYCIPPPYIGENKTYPISLDCLNQLYKESLSSELDLEYIEFYACKEELDKRIISYQYNQELHYNLETYYNDHYSVPIGFFDLVDERLNKEKIEAGTNVGVIAAQCISEPATQMSLDSFHFTGISSMAILGFPRMKELTQCMEKEKIVFVKGKSNHQNLVQVLIQDVFDLYIFNSSFNITTKPNWELRYLACFCSEKEIKKPDICLELTQVKPFDLEKVPLIIEQIKCIFTGAGTLTITHSNYLHELLVLRVYLGTKEPLPLILKKYIPKLKKIKIQGMANIIKQNVIKKKSKKEGFTNTLYTCSKCKQKKSFVVTKQVRRADEGESVFATCICGHKFIIK